MEEAQMSEMQMTKTRKQLIWGGGGLIAVFTGVAIGCMLGEAFIRMFG